MTGEGLKAEKNKLTDPLVDLNAENVRSGGQAVRKTFYAQFVGKWLKPFSEMISNPVKFAVKLIKDKWQLKEDRKTAMAMPDGLEPDEQMEWLAKRKFKKAMGTLTPA